MSSLTRSIPSRKRRSFQRALLQWYRRGRRRFPWRDGKRNAYQILIAELMLRKTDASKVAQLYDRFVTRHPDPRTLAKADENELRREIRILGIADRARLLPLMARRLVSDHDGRVPGDVGDLDRLPGVGLYTANAVLCFAYGRDTPLVDTNVIRVLSRVFSIRSEKRRARDDPRLWQFAAGLVPKGEAVSFNRALLDHAATICTSRNPRCLDCPLAGVCDFYSRSARPKSRSSALQLPGQ